MNGWRGGSSQSKVQLGSEPAGFEKGPDDVVGDKTLTPARGHVKSSTSWRTGNGRNHGHEEPPEAVSSASRDL